MYKRILIFLVSILMTTCANAYMFPLKEDIYYGFSIGKKHLDYADSYGRNFFPTSHSSVAALVGVKDDNFSYEVMGFYSRTRNRTSVVDFLEFQLGEESISGIGDDTYETQVKLSGLYLQTYYVYPVHIRADILVGLGLGVVKAKYRAEMTYDDDIISTADERDNNRVRVSTTALIPRISLGTLLHFDMGDLRVAFNYDYTQGLRDTFQRRLHQDAGNNIHNTIRTKNLVGLDFSFIF